MEFFTSGTRLLLYCVQHEQALETFSVSNMVSESESQMCSVHEIMIFFLLTVFMRSYMTEVYDTLL